MNISLKLNDFSFNSYKRTQKLNSLGLMLRQKQSILNPNFDLIRFYKAFTKDKILICKDRNFFPKIEFSFVNNLKFNKLIIINK